MTGLNENTTGLEYAEANTKRASRLVRIGTWVFAFGSAAILLGLWVMALKDMFYFIPTMVGPLLGGTGTGLAVMAIRRSPSKAGPIAACVLNVLLTIISLATAGLARLLIGYHGC